MPPVLVDTSDSCKYVGQSGSAAMLAVKRLAGSHQRWIWGTSTQARKHASESTLALKRQDRRHQKSKTRGISGQTKRTCVLQKLKKKKKKDLNIFTAPFLANPTSYSHKKVRYRTSLLYNHDDKSLTFALAHITWPLKRIIEKLLTLQLQLSWKTWKTFVPEKTGNYWRQNCVLFILLINPFSLFFFLQKNHFKDCPTH